MSQFFVFIFFVSFFVCILMSMILPQTFPFLEQQNNIPKLFNFIYFSGTEHIKSITDCNKLELAQQLFIKCCPWTDVKTVHLKR